MSRFSKGFLAFSLTLPLFLAALFYMNRVKTIRPSSNKEFAATAVMITNLEKTSGGTGVIVSSARGQSRILTNAHVCGIARTGALVISDNRAAKVESFQISPSHDLCLISVRANFKVNTVVSEDEPELFSDATIVGHPSLLPTIITRGHFTHKQDVSVITDIRPCTEADFSGPDADLCIFIGGIPTIRRYEAQVVSATISPGSSGSPVFNSDGEVAGLVFAGHGDLGYALIVPQEYIDNFLNNEALTAEVLKPDSSAQAKAAPEMRRRLKEACANETKRKAIRPEYCRAIATDALY